MAVTVAVVGASGRIARSRHLPALAAVRAEGLVDSVVLVSRESSRLADLVTRYPGCSTREWNEVVDDPAVSVVLDASPPQARTDITTKALEAGKNVLSEKPLGVNSREAAELVSRARRAGVVASMVRDKLFTPGFSRLRDLLDDGLLGEVTFASGEFGYWVDSGVDETRPAQRPSWNYRSDRGGDIVSDLFTHWTYMLELISPITAISAVSSISIPTRRDESGGIYDADVPDTLIAVGSCGGKYPFTVQNSWVRRPPSPFSLHVNGTLASVRITPTSATVFGESGEADEIPLDVKADEFAALWRDFLARVERSEPDVSGFDAGFRCAAVCDAIHRSIRESATIDLTEGHYLA